jgi:hypothetical protein
MKDWSILNLSTPRETFAAKVDSQPGVADHVKAFLKAQVEAMPKEVTRVEVNAYGQETTHPRQPNRSLANIQFTVVAVT